MDQLELTQDQLQIYDRQRFIGLDVQKRLITSNIIMVNCNGAMTELAKNMILSGANIIIFDDELVKQSDIDNNFLIDNQDLGKKKGEQIQKKLQNMNPMVKIQHIQKNLDINNIYQEKEFILIKQFDVIALASENLIEIELWDNYCRSINKPFYALVQCGLYGFMFIDLGPSYKFTVSIDNKGQQINIDKQQEQTINGLSLIQCINSLNKPSKDCFVYYAIKTMYYAIQRGLNINQPHENRNESYLNQIVLISQEVFQKCKQQMNEQSTLFIKNFARTYGIEYCPVYSIIGSVASQELIKVIGKTQEPAQNFFCYDSQSGYGKFEKSKLNS